MDKESSLHSEITIRLSKISDTPSLDASVLMAHVIQKSRSWVIAHPAVSLTNTEQKQLADSLVRLQSGEPLPYVLGHWEFFGLEFDVTPDVLIPRPETELLVEKAISWLKKLSVPDIRIADVGTGSGAIAVSLAVHIPNVQILATDISEKALNVAKRNARKFKVDDRIEFVECDLLPEKSAFKNRQSAFNMICANLPYIPTDELHRLPIYNREPTLALDGGANGLDLISKLITLAPTCLAQNGLILLEIGASQGAMALSLARAAFPNAGIELHQDLAGKDRLLVINFSRINIGLIGNFNQP